MCGEIGLQIKKIVLTRFREEDNYDMRIEGINGEFFHICGNNDLVSLLQESLNNIVTFPKK